MIETGFIVELSNNKKYIITDSSVEDNNIYYLTLEVDYETEVPTDNSMFFRQGEDDTLIPIKNQSDIEFLKTVFVNKFLDEIIEEN